MAAGGRLGVRNRIRRTGRLTTTNALARGDYPRACCALVRTAESVVTKYKTLIQPFTLKKAAFTRERSSADTRECS